LRNNILLEEGLQLWCHFGVTDMPVVEATKRGSMRKPGDKLPRFDKRRDSTEGKEGHCREEGVLLSRN
jgi:hypothetical protein